MSSVEFYDRYCAGEFPEFPHAQDFFTWGAYYVMGMDEPKLADLYDRR
jgi:hypothetical protein